MCRNLRAVVLVGGGQVLEQPGFAERALALTQDPQLGVGNRLASASTARPRISRPGASSSRARAGAVATSVNSTEPSTSRGTDQYTRSALPVTVQPASPKLPPPSRARESHRGRRHTPRHRNRGWRCRPVPAPSRSAPGRGPGRRGVGPVGPDHLDLETHGCPGGEVNRIGGLLGLSGDSPILRTPQEGVRVVGRGV